MTSSVTTTRPIREEQLSVELGGVALSSSRVGDETTVTADVPKATLQAAIDAHAPVPPPPSAEEQLAALKDRMAAAEAATDDIIIGALMGEFPPLT